ncbi:peptidyl-prolyl cis-trans isomerase [Rhizobium leguminosarum]|uniref:peptidylprolyl isomerase n=1 Tax=Rhizobium leguminosarum TaxID=384 RepID=UPI000FEC8B73|nr:peptidylprolyl isomerase [Rhizobium leguminosarum]RWX26545.1 peptidyl-prolyl cis-trans isomerase [Rhizobium leguminosarum]
MLIRKVLVEPLFHFLILGVVVFSLYTLTRQPMTVGEDLAIVVDEGQLARMFDTYSRTWQRPPTEDELKGLVEGYIKEEIFYREGQKMGLAQDDTVFRRRMQQKMEFLLEPSVEELAPKPGELEAYFTAHAQDYRLPEKLAFRQIFFRSERTGDKGDLSATAVLSKLKSDAASIDMTSLGDSSLLPERTALSDAELIATSFGQDFVSELASAPENRWYGPIRSAYGAHLVFVSERLMSHPLALSDAGTAVLADWESARRKDIADARYAAMKKRYDIEINWPRDIDTSPIKTSSLP